MVYIIKRKIKGREYRYIRKSIRLPNGKVKIIEELMKDKNIKKYKEILDKKERKILVDFAIKTYKHDYIFSKEEIKKIEEIKLNYKKLLKKLNKEQLKDIFDRFTANFTYESNAIEGNSLTLRNVAIVMFERKSIEGKSLREIYETRNSRKVIELIIKRKFDISHKDIIKMHKMLMKDIDIRTGYKKIPNVIIGSKIKTTSPEKVYEEMSKLIKFYKNNIKKINPIKLSALFHGKFEQIHPFEDGNGRVGRFLSILILIKERYPPLIIRNSQRIAYLKALTDFDKKYTVNLERFFLRKFKDTYKKFFGVYIKYI